jgi:hypothetical protein
MHILLQLHIIIWLYITHGIFIDLTGAQYYYFWQLCDDCHLWWLVMFQSHAIHANISSSQYQIEKFVIRKNSIHLMTRTWHTYHQINITMRSFALPSHVIMNSLILRHWYRIYHCDNECEISHQMALPTNKEICTWLHIYGMASKQSRMCVHVWRPWKMRTNGLLQI